MYIDPEKVKRKAKPSFLARPSSPIRVGRFLEPSKMRKRSEMFRIIFGAILLIAFTMGVCGLAWTLVSQGAKNLEIRAERERTKTEYAPVSMPITFKPSQK